MGHSAKPHAPGGQPTSALGAVLVGHLGILREVVYAKMAIQVLMSYNALPAMIAQYHQMAQHLLITVTAPPDLLLTVSYAQEEVSVAVMGPVAAGWLELVTAAVKQGGFWVRMNRAVFPSAKLVRDTNSSGRSLIHSWTASVPRMLIVKAMSALPTNVGATIDAAPALQEVNATVVLLSLHFQASGQQGPTPHLCINAPLQLAKLAKGTGRVLQGIGVSFVRYVRSIGP